jgi:protein tyrosine/serine phosphatase
MLARVWGRIRTWERGLKGQFSHDIEDPAARRWSRVYADWYDHAALRLFWHNFHEVAPGFFRSNHPGHARFRRYAAMGIREVVNIRGGRSKAPFKFEVESCAALGLRLHVTALSARRAPEPYRLVELLDIFDALRGPSLVHCKSGADRTGFAAAVYLIHVCGTAVDIARRQLSPLRAHAKWTASGVLDLVLAEYAAAQARGVGFRDWVERHYEPEAIQARFDAMGPLERLRI